MDSQQCPFGFSVLRSVAALVALTTSLLVAGAFGQDNPIPQVVGPPHPQAVTPGGGDFTLKVYGANFVPGAVVNWNRQPRATTYVSGHEVDATILASDIASNTAGYITATNPPPGGGVSSAGWTLVEVHEPTATIAPPAKPAFYGYAFQGEIPELLVADFNNDGIMDLADFDAIGTIPIYLGAANGTFTYSDLASSLYWPIFSFNNATYGDFNGDGNVDLAYDSYLNRSSSTGLDVSLGDGNGRFTPGWKEDQIAVANVLAGDFNCDGNLDLIAGYSSYTYVYLGNGDGTFNLSETLNFGPTGIRLAGDFNGDGNLDLVLVSDSKPTKISVALGNGDGTFQQPRTITSYVGGCDAGPTMLVNDFNGDGKLDIAFCTWGEIGVLLGNGDGTFRQPIYYDVYPFGDAGSFSFAAGDFNSDGKTDLIVSNNGLNTQFSVLLGNGDGTFQKQQSILLSPKGTNGELGIQIGDFNSDGLLDFILQEGGYSAGVYLQEQP